MSRHWTFEEDKIISDNYDTIGIKVCEQLPGRTVGAVRARANTLRKKEEERQKYIKFWDALLYCHITETDAEVPENFKENFNKVCEELLKDDKHQRGVSVINMFYKEGLSYEEIGYKLGLSREYVLQIHNKYIRMLRLPDRRYILDHGEPKTKEEPFKISTDPCGEKIDVLNLSVRAYNVLKRGGVNTVGQLTSANESDLLKLRNMSTKVLNEIKETLAKNGLELSK